MLDARCTLADGRILAYTDLGAADGPVVFYFHGAPTSRLDLVPLDDELRRRGVRVVCPDRPGYGESSPQPGRHLTDWPADVAALADHLDVDTFSVIGLSSGGPYAVVCAALMPERVDAAGVVAGVTDMHWPGAWDGYDAHEVEIMRLGDADAAVAWCTAKWGADGAGFLASTSDRPPVDADQALQADPVWAGALYATVTEAFRQGVVGFAHDVTVQAEPWSFDPSDIVVPMRVVHGDLDPVVPLGHGRHTAALVPTATLRVLPGHGHLSMLGTVAGMAAELAGLAPTTPRLNPRRADDDPRLGELFAKGLNGPDGTPLNIFGTLAHHPDLLRRWLVFATHTLSKNTISERDRELLILRTGWNCRSRYEFGQHVVIGMRCGITADEIEQVKMGPRGGWSDHERLLMVAADELHQQSMLSDITWAALTDHYSTEQVLDLVATVGNYHLVAMLLNSTGVALDDGVPRHL